MGLAVVPVAQRAWVGQKQAMAARRWPQTTGVVISFGVQEEWVGTAVLRALITLAIIILILSSPPIRF